MSDDLTIKHDACGCEIRGDREHLCSYHEGYNDGLAKVHQRDTYDGPTLPNNWPVPTFMSVDKDGLGFTIEWCFGEQGKPGSWRVMYSFDLTNDPRADCPHDYTIVRTTHTPFKQEQAYDLLEMDRWLKEAVEVKEKP